LILERNLLDLAADFSSPQVFNAVRTAYESKSKKKDNQQVRNRRKSKTKNQKPTNLNLVCPNVNQQCDYFVIFSHICPSNQ